MTAFSRQIETDIRRVVKGECAFDDPTRDRYSTDGCWYSIKPLGVVKPAALEDVQALVRYCSEHDIAIIARGAASGLAGQSIGYGIIVDFASAMRSIVSEETKSITVQPGLILSDLNNHLLPKGTHFPIDPASAKLCTIGGMIATNAAGAHGIKYGSTKDYVKSLSVVLSNGELATINGEDSNRPGSPLFSSITATLTPLLTENKKLIRERFPNVAKNSSGYNLLGMVSRNKPDYRRLLVGSEGTLALTVEATLGLEQRPLHRVGALLYFSSYEKTADATQLSLELHPSAVEILDHTYVSLVKGLTPEIDALIVDEAKAMLYVEFEGNSKDEITHEIVKLNRTASLSLPLKFLPLTTEVEIQRLWHLREEASRVINVVKSKGKTSFIEDVAVPLHRLTEYLKGLADILGTYGIEFSVYGHAGAGNIHCAAFVDLRNIDHYKAIDTIASEVYDLAIGLGGTLSGEHGDGLVRTPFLERLYGPEVYTLFRRVKQAFDPKNILNPGKIIGPQNVSLLHDLAL